MANSESPNDSADKLKKHTKFFERCMDILPSYCQSLDTSRFDRLLSLLNSILCLCITE